MVGRLGRIVASSATVPESHSIYLIPGFFGFANLGRMRYFVHVDRWLRTRFSQRGIPAHIHVVHIHPTASLPRRAARVIETMARTGRGRRGPIHLIGHSSGGVDARLVTTPHVSLPTEADVARTTERVRTVLAVGTPHRGTPLASFLTTRGGQQLLGLLSLTTSYVLRFGHVPLSALAHSAAIFHRPGQPAQNTLVDELSQRLLADFSPSRRRSVARLLLEVRQDQSLMLQLTPEAMDVFNATVHDRPGVRYASIVTRSRPPGLASTLRAGIDPGAQAIHAIYQGLYRLAARVPARTAPAPLDPLQRRVLRSAYGKIPSARANDGIVPTRAQVWGDVLAALDADHLDVIGHFNDPAADPPHYDWLTTGSGFDRSAFERTWDRVVDFLLA